MKNEPISRIMTGDAATIPPTSSVAAAERLMRERRCHHLPVVEADGSLVGMLAAHDLMKALVLRSERETEVLGQASLERRRVAEIMRRKVPTLPQTATLLDAAETLAEAGDEALAVVAPNGALLGVVTTTDLLETLVDGLRHPVGGAGAAVHEQPAAARTFTEAQVEALLGIYRAALNYLESGRGDLEHGRLLQAVNRAREALRRSELHI